MTRPLLVTGDETLLEELLRLAAAAGVTPEIAADPAGVLRAWSTAPCVLVGGDVVARAARAAPERRDGVHVVAWQAGADTFRAALTLGAREVCELPRAESHLVALLLELADAGRPPGPVVGVVGGSGGSGATTLACTLAQVGAAHGPTLVLDCDPQGPGADRVLGLEGRPGVRWDVLARGGGRLGAGALRDAVPSHGGVGVLTWPPDVAAVDAVDGVAHREVAREAVAAGRRGHALVVLDLPRGGDDHVVELAGRCDLVLVVVVGSVPAVASALRTCARLRDAATLGLVVRGRGLAPEELARVADLPVVGVLPEARGIAESVDLGLGPVRSARGPLARAARDLLALPQVGLVPGRGRAA
ncbi:septum site-determining protein Ssd [Nocardioides sp. CFH 31398]|uniref:septum site-determining protein Ssd n=1 Tax=Nocardioides sp. CFH 31398 TaxID=2919579 RepID=UPI001F05E40F|nr:septum site-determining protein Ssd [Nocardioides sp. CFH 31398]MCH1867762.1 septum site determining protein [Nocardioides sp. CFH 31398]